MNKDEAWHTYRMLPETTIGQDERAFKAGWDAAHVEAAQRAAERAHAPDCMVRAHDPWPCSCGVDGLVPLSSPQLPARDLPR